MVESAQIMPDKRLAPYAEQRMQYQGSIRERRCHGNICVGEALYRVLLQLEACSKHSTWKGKNPIDSETKNTN